MRHTGQDNAYQGQQQLSLQYSEPYHGRVLDERIHLGEKRVSEYRCWHCRQASQHQEERRKFILTDGVELELDYAPAKVCEVCYLSASAAVVL